MAFGRIHGAKAGAQFADYAAMIDAGVHRQRTAGMVGGAAKGTESIVLNGGYVDDQDFGNVIVYTGFGGRDSSGHQVADQQWIGANQGMRVNLTDGIPVRVIRGAKGQPGHSPSTGYRYDGLYRVDHVWQETGADGFTICRFRLVAEGETAGIPEAEAAATPAAPTPKFVASTVIRRVRDTHMSRTIKHKYKKTCQICGTQLALPGGAVYAEGAHVRPLGTPHDGDDVAENLLCLCPNHHVLLDRGAIFLSDELAVIDGLSGQTIGLVTLARGHSISQSNLRYHREIFGY